MARSRSLSAECAPGCHSWDWRARDDQGRARPRCRACRKPKTGREPHPNELGFPFGYADMPDSISCTSTDYQVASWVSWSNHPRKRAVVAMLDGTLPEWEVGWRVGLHDVLGFPHAEPHDLYDSLSSAAWRSAEPADLSGTVGLVRGWFRWVAFAGGVHAAFLAVMVP